MCHSFDDLSQQGNFMLEYDHPLLHIFQCIVQHEFLEEHLLVSY